LMQLVAALRYEPKLSEESENIPGSRESLEESFMSSRLTQDSNINPASTSPISPLATFLIHRACQCAPPYSFANFLYYFLKVESEADERFGKMYNDVFKSFLSALPDHIQQVLRDQREYTDNVSECQLKAFNTKGNRDVKQKEMSRLLALLGKELNGKKTAPSPVNPHIMLKGVDSNVKMFQSALYPAAVTFSIEPSEEASLKYERDMGDARLSASDQDGMSSRIAQIEQEYESRKKLKMMIKNGDDVRQDQLILQMFKVMDRCLKRVGLDLKLTIYGVLATSPKSGFMEFVCAEDGSPSSAIELLDMSIGDYLRLHQPAKAGDDGDQGISKEGLEVFASSMAGYAVITYILGVGDRHLGNLLMLPNGRMCHIDFGFVFGDDPKKKFVNPPPFRITKSMVDVMGGQKGEVFQQIFCRKAFGAYKELRHNAVLIMSLLRLMKDSGIEALMENREAKLQTVEDRFRLDLNDEDAEIFMAGIIQESMTHVGIQVLEGFHNIARIMR
jgi:phosphatidylinositol 3-kinase